MLPRGSVGYYENVKICKIVQSKITFSNRTSSELGLGQFTSVDLTVILAVIS